LGVDWRVQGLGFGFRVQCSGLGDLGFVVSGFCFRILGAGFTVSKSRVDFKVQRLRFGIFSSGSCVDDFEIGQ